MSKSNSNLRSLLSPARSGTFFAPFRSRNANPDGFDSKMKLWISAIEEWAVQSKQLTLTLNDIHQIFISDAGIRPDKECIRLVLSEMKRRSKVVPMKSLRTSSLWSASESLPYLDNIIDPKSWIGWGVKNLVYNPASWAVSSLTTGNDQIFSDLIDTSITDNTIFVCSKSLQELSQRLFAELIRISKAEKQVCFEWQHLLELITPIMNTIIEATDSKGTLEMLDILIEYLCVRRHVSIQVDNDTKLLKVSDPESTTDDDVAINKKDIAMARLLRAKELLTADADRYHNQAEQAKISALESYKKREVAKAKSLLRSHKRLTACAEQKETQLTNVEIMLEQLENTDSNMMILQAYKDGAEALKIANTNLESNTTVLDEMHDVTAEARYLNDEMNQMLNNISSITQGTLSQSALEEELNAYIAEGAGEQNQHQMDKTQETTQAEPILSDKGANNLSYVEDLEARLNSLIVCNEEPTADPICASTPKKIPTMPSRAL